MTPINTYSTQDQALIVKGMLASYGIPSHIETNASSDLFPSPSGGIGKSVLYVPDDKAEEAMSLLRAHGDA